MTKILFMIILSVIFSCKRNTLPESEGGNILSLRMRPANELYKSGEIFNAENIEQLLFSVSDDNTDLTIKSSSTNYVMEENIREGTIRPSDLDKLGYNNSNFVVDSTWATIRFNGPDPAGAGLKGQELDNVQKEKLGTPFDTIPVVTAAWIINKMMTNFFVPLIKRLPDNVGTKILKEFKIQGAFFSPLYKGNVKADRNNAYLVGLQSLYLWPSSCFESLTYTTDCKKPYMSTGHDPTIIGHELGHAVFNHLQNKNNLEGFQWLSVNEGYADYFSAAFFSEPMLGRIWKMSATDNSYLRKIQNNNKELKERELSNNAHQYGVIWSSLLWRIRERLKLDPSYDISNFDLVALNAIRYLGATTSLYFGDAVNALLRSSDELAPNETILQGIISEEIQKSEILLSNNTLASNLDAQPKSYALASAPKPSTSFCGNIGMNNEKAQKSSNLLLFLPFLVILVRIKKIYQYIFLIFLSSCKLNILSKDEVKSVDNKVTGIELVYNCNAGLILKRDTEIRDFIFTFIEETNKATSVSVMISDNQYREDNSAVILIVDKIRRVVDQVRNLEGKPLQIDLNATQANADLVNAGINAKVGTFLLEKVYKNMTDFSQTEQNLCVDNVCYDMTFFNRDKKYYTPLIKEIKKKQNKVCVLKK